MEPDRSRPILLAPDVFTPEARTPWGGHRIAGEYKRAWLPEARRGERVGESWEISMGPELPSPTEDGRLLGDVFADDPLAFLGFEALRGRRTSALLVKLVDAEDVLSVQIHPPDGDPLLASDESGKPESWYILDHHDGAGIYLGLHPNATLEEMTRLLESGGDVSQMLAFVPVRRGDFFVLEPGTPHAIGAGVTLAEPQRVAPGKRGVTWRYWDWNRTYGGVGRPLHVAQALSVTRWDAPRGDALLARIRLQSGAPELDAPASLRALAGPGGLDSAHLAVARLAGTGVLVLPAPEGLRGLTVVEGEVSVDAPGGAVVVGRGRSAVLPYSLGAARLTLRRAHAVLSAVTD